MALSKEHLESIAIVLTDFGGRYLDPTRYLLAAKALYAERDRLENGPFTLAEAIASGRPFRRNGWVPGLYADDIYDSECGHCESEGPMRFSFVRVDIENAYVESEDTTATDYEIQPEGGE